MGNFYEALGEVARAIHVAGIEIEGSIPTGGGHGKQHGYKLDYRHHRINVYGYRDGHRFSVTYHFRLSSHLSDLLDPEDARSQLQTHGYTADEVAEMADPQVCQFAAQERVENLDASFKDEWLEKTQGRRAQSDVELHSKHLGEDHPEVWDGFSGSQYIYPYDGLSQQEFDRVLQSVYDIGLYLADKAIEVTDLPEIPAQVAMSDPEDSPNDSTPGFH